MDPSETLYDREHLVQLKFQDWSKATFHPSVSVANFGDGLKLRPLQFNDFENGKFNFMNMNSLKTH